MMGAPAIVAMLAGCASEPVAPSSLRIDLAAARLAEAGPTFRSDPTSTCPEGRIWAKSSGEVSPESASMAYAQAADAACRPDAADLRTRVLSFEQSGTTQQVVVTQTTAWFADLIGDEPDAAVRITTLLDVRFVETPTEAHATLAAEIVADPPEILVFELDSAEFAASIGDPEALMRLARLTPHVSAHGGPDGYRVSGIRRNSPLADLGLRNGDVLHSVDGKPAENADYALATYQSLLVPSPRTIRVEITRRGEPMTLEYILK